ncbi:HPr family phosphocarrier protein [Cellulomonas fimi]|uniref:Phosphocarrier protein HPr n=1 Tax=Cellulomonas fimi TaxID=1708 RepID=A0A7Y0LXE7_CELFI|nr:HPr family phosphocarrier protein [Cellulomonas fimi]NMR19656.1 HPr family phosphocarrier protein [Cellulomonas fimi]
MPHRRVTIAIAEGLHARPAALFVKLASEQPAKVTIRTDDSEPVDSDSILGVMTLGAGAGDVVVLDADGAGADESLDALETYLTTAG